MNKKAANILEYILCILIAAGFILAIIFAAMHDDSKRSKYELMACNNAVNQLSTKQDDNQSIINYLYESDMRGEIRLDSQTIFWLGRIE